MADKSMCSLNDYTLNYPVCRLQIVFETLGTHSSMDQLIKIKVPKVVSQRIRKVISNFGDQLNEQPMSPTSL